MPTLTDVLPGSLAQAVQVQQIIDALKGTPSKGVAVALVSLNDPSTYALTIQNDDPTNSRALSVLKADGTTLISADATGVTLGAPLSLPSGSINGSMIAASSITSAQIVDGTIESADIGAQQVQYANIAPNAVGTGQIQSSAITSALILDGTIQSVDIGAQQVQNPNIAPLAVATGQIQVNACTNAAGVVGSSANPTTTSTTNVDLPDMTISIGTVGGDLLIWLVCTLACSLSGQTLQLQLNLDGADTGPVATAITAAVNQQMHLSLVWRVAAPTAGTHTIKGRWNTSGGTATATWQYRSLVVEEIRR